MNTDAMFSSKSDAWATPQKFFDELNAEFHFNLDPCADSSNAKCDKFFTEEDDGLTKSWEGYTVFCNPPYGRNTTGKWIEKAYRESRNPNTMVVCLVPARTDTRWFHDYVIGKSEIRFVRGRLKFGDGTSPAPFPSMVVIFGSDSPNLVCENSSVESIGG